MSLGGASQAVVCCDGSLGWLVHAVVRVEWVPLRSVPWDRPGGLPPQPLRGLTPFPTEPGNSQLWGQVGSIPITGSQSAR